MSTGQIAVALRSVTDWTGFSRAVRALHAQGVAPQHVLWRTDDAPAPDLFDAGGDAFVDAHALPQSPPLHLPKSFVDEAREVFLHSDDGRLSLLHQMVAQIAVDTRAWSDPLHGDRPRFDHLLREVRREIHKMHAFVRFRRIDESAGSARHVAWFEPGHHVLEAAAPFFARRFATMRWAILTPRVSVAWDGSALAFGDGAAQSQCPPPDAGEALWLAYYRSIFNPARLKVAMMKKEMPVRFWKNLPEAAAIGPLIADACARSQHMIDQGGAQRLRRRARSGAADAEPAPEVAGARDLESLARLAARCRDCPVAERTTQTVFGEGSMTARLMIVGEQPGDHEDLRGRPFQGPAGQLLRDAFGALGWDAGDLYLTNAVKHFHHELRGKRRIHKTPGQQEAAACLHWLEAEIEALQPRAIVALGATAARSLLGRAVAVRTNAGQWLERADGIPVLICLHPAAILRADSSTQEAIHAEWLQTLRGATVALEPQPSPV
jgi:probable DNA metabolism protein